MQPLISVVVPVYRVEAYLGRCVESLRAQTYGNLEILLVDDGSPDGCSALCDAYAKEDGRILAIHQENQGLSGARNTGIGAAKGEYLAFVDSDDYVAKDFLQTLYEALERTGSSIAQCRFAYVQGGPLKASGSQKLAVYEGEALMEKLYGPEEEATCFVVAWNKLYQRKLFQKIRYPKGRIHEDEATTYRLFDEGKRLVSIDAALYGYFTENTGSITARFSKERLQWLTAHEERIDFFKENGYGRLLPRAYRKLCDACITFYFRCEGEKDAARLQEGLRERFMYYRQEGSRWIRELPLRTRVGYCLFGISPALYRNLLERMQKP